MRDRFVSFDTIRDRVAGVFRNRASEALSEAGGIYLIRDLLGKVHISVSEEMETSETCRVALQDLAHKLHETLGPHGYPLEEDAVLFVDSAMLEDLEDEALVIHPGVYLADRLVTGALGAHVLLFAVDAESHWTDYAVLSATCMTTWNRPATPRSTRAGLPTSPAPQRFLRWLLN